MSTYLNSASFKVLLDHPIYLGLKEKSTLNYLTFLAYLFWKETPTLVFLFCFKS